jgi:arylsulfatase A
MRWSFLLCLLGMSLGAGPVVAGQKPARPNVIVIMADDMGYECVGANGGTSYKTPFLDKLAAGGMRFQHCYVQPLCTPTRVQLMTGLYNQRNYIRFGLLDPKAVTFAQLFKRAGYATCIVGKWQLAGGFEAPQHFGFDEYCLWQLTIRKSRYANPVIERNGKVIEYTKGEYGPDIVSDYLCDFLERNRDRPFLAYYPMMLPHGPFVPTPDSKDYNPKATDEATGNNKKYFADMVAYTDKMVGKVIAKLDALGLREKTLVVFLCDNGTGKGLVSRLGNQDIIGDKGSTTNAGTHVPLIASWPGKIAAGKVSNDLVDSTDFFPTILEAIGQDIPKDLALDGRSFFPQLLGQPGQPRAWSYSWYARDGGPTGTESARTQRYKLYADGRFLNLKADPLEKNPLPANTLSPEMAQVRAQLHAALKQFEGTRKLLDPGQKGKKGKKRIGES